jgi:hypothetical protein
MMTDAQVTGARALQDLYRLSQYLDSAEPRSWSAEKIGSLDASSLNSLLTALDQSASIELSSQLMLEFTDTFCRVRDQRYANRSRKWLYTRAGQTKALRAYELWSAFLKENQTQDLQTNFLNQDPKSLAGVDFKTLLTLPPNSTKLAVATAHLAEQALH